VYATVVKNVKLHSMPLCVYCRCGKLHHVST